MAYPYNVPVTHRDLYCPLLNIAGGVEITGYGAQLALLPVGTPLTWLSWSDTWVSYLGFYQLRGFPLLGYVGLDLLDQKTVYSARQGLVLAYGTGSDAVIASMSDLLHRGPPPRRVEKSIANVWHIASIPDHYSLWIEKARAAGVQQLRIHTVYASLWRPTTPDDPATPVSQDPVPTIPPFAFDDELSEHLDAAVTWIPSFINNQNWTSDTGLFVNQYHRVLNGWPHRLSIAEDIRVVEVECDPRQFCIPNPPCPSKYRRAGNAFALSWPAKRDVFSPLRINHPTEGRLDINFASVANFYESQYNVPPGNVADPSWFGTQWNIVPVPAAPYDYSAFADISTLDALVDEDTEGTWRTFGLAEFSEGVLACDPLFSYNGNWVMTYSSQWDGTQYVDYPLEWGTQGLPEDVEPPHAYRVVVWDNGFYPTRYSPTVVQSGTTDASGIAELTNTALTAMEGKSIAQAQIQTDLPTASLAQHTGYWYDWYETYYGVPYLAECEFCGGTGLVCASWEYPPAPGDPNAEEIFPGFYICWPDCWPTCSIYEPSCYDPAAEPFCVGYGPCPVCGYHGFVDNENYIFPPPFGHNSNQYQAVTPPAEQTRIWIADAYSRPCPVAAAGINYSDGAVMHKAYWFSNVVRHLTPGVWLGDWDNWTVTYNPVTKKISSAVNSVAPAYRAVRIPTGITSPSSSSLNGRDSLNKYGYLSIRFFDDRGVFLGSQSLESNFLTNPAAHEITIDPEVSREVFAVARVLWYGEDWNRQRWSRVDQHTNTVLIPEP